MTAMPLGKATSSATWRTEPSGVTRAIMPGGEIAAREVETDVVQVNVASAVDDDLVPWSL